MGRLINIDNGGTLTDVCVIDGDRVHHTKTITTPYDLSKCLMEGIRQASIAVLGRDDVEALLQGTDCIRYSTTQGTNSLVERKGPRLGLLTDSPALIESLQRSEWERGLFGSLVGSRTARLDTNLDGESFTKAVVDAINQVTVAGAHRIVVSFDGADHRQQEFRVNRAATRMFPCHLLGAVPMLYAGAITADPDIRRRTWTALYNAFLHPAMERFLYNAEGLLRPFRMRKPLLIYGNGGLSGKVSKTTALRTYSSGPRGGMESARVLSDYYGLKRVLSLDVGGTTTDIGLVEDGVIRRRVRGSIEGVECSLPLCDIVSVGIGGGSIFRVTDGHITVGPDSVGGAPGPACFGLGGQEPTITDALLLMGMLDPTTYFGGAMVLDAQRARAVVQERIAAPLGISVEAAVHAMQDEWAQAIGIELQRYAEVTPDTTLLAFGGGGPLAILTVAAAVGADRVLVPRLAAVFSAYGIGFSDIGHVVEAELESRSDAALAGLAAQLRERAARDMFSEGFEARDCEFDAWLTADDEETPLDLVAPRLDSRHRDAAAVAVAVRATRRISRPELAARTPAQRTPAVSSSSRNLVTSECGSLTLPVIRVEQQIPGASGSGPAVLEERFWTCHVPTGWAYEFTPAGDVLFTRAARGVHA